ncbi:GLPGLI family protein [Halpernia humi]|uniref:GLPGLI family protein n=1 Tax=Halpernia humi TaxID=493375 RepID=A0A1H5V2L3_9FLAO|nr:GLPGLI family protein [Halpernia humi]SEF80968.1 GLPGLI family protein [Halpernia humi]
MKRLVFLVLPFLFSAQTHRFIYEYQFKTDSTSADYEKTNMVLDINPVDVKFYDYDYAKNDSINKLRDYKNYIWNDTPAIVRKKNSNENLNFELLNDYFAYKSIDKIDWKLSPETKKVGQYNLQKATSNFGGRNWTAWFNPEIPLNEGPYKFRGLPGLIFEISDSQQQFIFKLIKSYQLASTYKTMDFLETQMDKKPLLVTKATLDKIKLDFYNDPYHEIRENFVYKPDETIKLMNVRITSKDQINDATKSYQKYIRKNNNVIERDKALKYPEN